jgi:hypothetical protein
MLNEHTFIEKGTEKLVGVEVGNNFKKAGDINKAPRAKSKDFKILMSHDPSH